MLKLCQRSLLMASAVPCAQPTRSIGGKAAARAEQSGAGKPFLFAPLQFQTMQTRGCVVGQ